MPEKKSKPTATKPTMTVAQTRRQELRDRLQRAIAAPRAQKEKAALLERMEGDDPADWEEILAELAEHDNLTISHRDDGSAQIFWTLPKD